MDFIPYRIETTLTSHNIHDTKRKDNYFDINSFVIFSKILYFPDPDQLPKSDSISCLPLYFCTFRTEEKDGDTKEAN